MKKGRIAIVVLVAGVVATFGPIPRVGAQTGPTPGSKWTLPQTYSEYLKIPLNEKIKTYREVIKDRFFKQWATKKIQGKAAEDPSLGAFDEYLGWLPLSPVDMLEVQMVLTHTEFAIPRMAGLLNERWITIHFGQSSTGGGQATPGTNDDPSGQSPSSPPATASSAQASPPGSGPLATVGTNRDSAYLYSPPPDNFDGEIQVVVNPLNANQVVSMSNTWDNMGDTANCGGGTQAIFFSSNGGTTWGYNCAPRGNLYPGLSCTNEAGSDPALYWDDANNVYADYMSLCYNSTWTSVNGYAMVVAKSTDGGATWNPHGVIQNSYTNGQSEDKNFYIIDNHATSPYYGRHYSCWDRGNNELIKYSTDGGVSWTEVNLPATTRSMNLGCEMAVQKNGTIHIVYDGLTCGATNCTGETMYYSKSTDGAATWSSPVLVQDFTNPISFGASSKYGPQDQRGLNPFGAIDVDNSGGSCDGYLYATFTDDPANNGIGTADIWVKRSTNGGSTWGSAVRVNDTANPDTSIQFHPFLVVDQSNGDVYVAWHDARNDANNRKVDFYVARSTDCGLTWTNVQASQPSSEFNNSTISYTDENSTDNANYNPNQFGEYMGLDVLNGTAYLAWCDSRQFFPGSSGNTQKENVGFTKVAFATCSATAPTGVSASASGNNAIQLSWSAASGATQYRIYRSTTTGGPYTQVGTTTTTSYLDNQAQGGATYYYVVTTYTTCESSYSTEVSATAAGPCTLPPTFSGISSAAANGCVIDLAWSAATANCGGPVSYAVYRSTTSPFTPALSNRIAAGVTGTTYTDSNGIVVGTPYYYVVRATDDGNGQEETNTTERSAATSASSTWTEDFESGSTGWTTAGTTNLWHEVNGTTCVTPSASSGTHAWYYGQDSGCTYDTGAQTTGTLTSPTIANVTSSSQLSFQYWREVESYVGGGYDITKAEVSYDGGTTWTQVWYKDCADAADTPWTASGPLTLSPPTSPSDMQIRFIFNSVDGQFNTYTGWLIDDVSVTNLAGGGCSSTPSDVAALTARSTSGAAKLEWVYPAGSNAARICRSTAAYPTDPATCSQVANPTGTAGAYASYTDTGLTNGTKYYYTLFVNNGGVFSGGKHAWAYPFDTTGKVKWSYSSAATALAPTGVRPGAIGTGGTWAVSNDRMLHGMNPTTAGGDWPRTTPYAWAPMAMNGPAQARPPVVPTTAVSGANQVIFLGSEDGHVYAVNAETGATLWQSPALGNMLLASPAGMFTDFGGAWNLLFIGSRDATADNKMYMLNPANGAIISSFNNGGAPNGIGIISSSATVDYASHSLYFTSRARAGGSSDTIWCLGFDNTSFWVNWVNNVGDADGAPVVYQGRVYVGTNSGQVWAWDATSGALLWTYTPSTADGAVKGFVMPEFTTSLPRKLYFSTTNWVWALTDNGSSASLTWQQKTVPGPSIPLAPVHGTRLYVGSSDGNLYQLDVSTGAKQISVQLGDGTATIGSPALDVVNNMAYVGSESGAVYGVALPLK